MASRIIEQADGHRAFIPISTHINEVDYDPSTQYLEIEFSDMQRYRMLAVPTQVFEDFAAADSAGKFFIRQIKSRYAELQV